MKKILFFVLAVILLCLSQSVSAQDLRAQLDVKMLVTPHSDGTDVSSAAIDSRNFKSQLICVYAGIATYSAEAKLDVILKECATAVGSFTPVVDSKVWGPQTVDDEGVILTIDEELTAGKMYEILYLGRSPYVKVTCDYTGGFTATPTVQVFAVQGGKIIQE